MTGIRHGLKSMPGGSTSGFKKIEIEKSKT